MESSTYQTYHERIKEFPCAFNLVCAEKVTSQKLRDAKRNLVSELENEGDCESEVIRKNNLLTWILFRLDKQDEAVQLSNEVIHQTKSNNIASLGNRFFVMWNAGDEVEAKKCVELLEKMKAAENFCSLFIEARAEQAYYYSRLGGPDNLRRAISLFSEAVKEIPGNYLWKFGLGLVYRRATHTNIYCSSPERLEIERYKKEAIRYFFEVADNADKRLQAMAYAQLAFIRQFRFYPEYNALFRHLDVRYLCKKALQDGGDLSSVLTHCGKVMRAFDVDESIRLLQKSVEVKKSSMTYHYLGQSYKRKAQLLTKKNRCGQVTEATAVQISEVSGACASAAEVNTTRRQLFSQSEPSHWSGSQNGTQKDGKGNMKFPRASFTAREANRLEPMTVCNERQTSLEGWRQDYGRKCKYYDKQIQDASSGDPPTDTNNKYDFQSVNKNFNQYSRKLEENRHSRGKWHRNTFARSSSYDSTVKLQQTSSDAHETYRHYQNIGVDAEQNNLRRKEDTPHSTRAPRLRSSCSEGNWKPEDEIGAYVRKCRNSLELNKDDELVKNAVNCFKKAIELTKENTPAILELGILFKETGQIQEALTQFNKVTNFPFSSSNHRVTAISAYEQAGICYLQLAKMEGDASSYMEEGKKKLTEAIRLAAELTITLPELKNSAQVLWTAFTTLDNEINREKPSQIQYMKRIKLLELTRDYGQITEVVQKVRALSEDGLDDQKFIMIALKSYLKEKQHAKALALQNLVALKPAVRDSYWWNNNPMRALRVTVLLHTIVGRLNDLNENPTALFQQLFELSFGTCVGLCAHEEDEHTGPAGYFVGDVLLVFDGDQDSEEDPNPTVKYARCLKNVSTCLFGLEAEENLKLLVVPAEITISGTRQDQWPTL